MDSAQLYDAFTITPILFLEDLGFCEKGEGGAFVADGAIAPGGSLRVNTSGGGLSYGHPGMNGLPLLVEAVREVREEGKDVVLAHGNGGVLSAQATVLLGSEAAAGQRPRTKAMRLREPAGATMRSAAPGDHEGGCAMSATRKTLASRSERAHESSAASVVGLGLRGRQARCGGAGAGRARRARASRCRTTIEQPVELGSIVLPAPRIAAPPGAPWSVDPRDRIEHAYGRSFPDTVRAFRGRIDHPPDAVAFARNEEDVEAVLEWAAAEDVAVIPFGGGTSVVGGVEPRVPSDRLGVVSLDLSRWIKL